MFPAARLTDAVGCPVCGTGVISLVKQYKTVIAMFPAARVTDIAGHGGMIAKGELKVLIGG